MLEFYFDFIDKYLDRSDFQYCEMDIDSAYIAIAGESATSLVRPKLRDEFEADKHNWFARSDTPEHRAYDKRTPGLFKTEWEGDGIIGLCSKTLTALVIQINLVVKEFPRNVMLSIKINILTCC